MAPETLLLIVLLAAPFALLLAATRARRAKEGETTAAFSHDRTIRSSTVTGVTGLLLLLAGPVAWFRAPHGLVRLVFALPIIAGVVLLVSAYRLWVRAMHEERDDGSKPLPPSG